MKKTLIISIGVIVILSVIAVWVYLLLFGTPKQTDDVFANLGFESSPINNEPTLPTPQTLPNDAPTKALRQLTTKPVAGFSFIGNDDTILRFVERGVGHVYELDTTTTAPETKINNTTVARVFEATFSPNAEHLTLTTDTDGSRATLLLSLADGSASDTPLINLPQQTTETNFVSDSQLAYTVLTDGGTDGYTYNLLSGQPTKVFSIPLRSVRTIWDTSSADTLNTPYVYNRVSDQMTGSLYKIVSDTLRPVIPSAYGLVATVNNGRVFSTANTGAGDSISTITSLTTDARETLPIQFIPEKCTVSNADISIMWCAAPLLSDGGDALVDWYQGTRQSEDILWKIDLNNMSALSVSNLQQTAGRAIDVFSITTSQNGEKILFSNKNDNTLWLYDTTL